jgi:outer membrane protein OmpA-like peptidoglycan-associated protein
MPSITLRGVLAALLFLAARPALADGFSGQRFLPAIGAAGGLVVERPVVPRHLGFGVGLFTNYAWNPVVMRLHPDGQVVAAPLQHALSFDLLGSIGFFDFLEVGLDLPIHAVYAGDAGGQTLVGGAGLGDLRLDPKVAWWVGRSPALQITIGGDLPISFPTGSAEALRGAGGVTIEPRFLFGLGQARWSVVTNLGFRGRLSSMALDLTGAYELTYGLAGTFGVLTGKVPLDLQAELVGGFQPNGTTHRAPLELLAGAVVWPHREISVYAALGPGLTSGLGAPDLRALVGVRWAHRVPGRDRFTDTDGDGIPDYRDDCPTQPEDMDGWQDDDGCPDPDNDHDGIPDDRDECPTQAEEPGGNGDGCPDKARVVIRRGKVVVFGKVQFATGSAKILTTSYDLLDQIAQAMREHDDIASMRIEGHTDNIGGADFNQKLSQQRAEAVTAYLVSKGVDGKKLETRGLGLTQPLAPNDTPAGRAQNRRVEFVARHK